MYHKILSKSRIKNIKAQGYFNYSDQEISALAFGNRFAYILCAVILIFAIVNAGILLLSFMLAIAVSAVFLDNHPFDYIYNAFIAEPSGRPKLPPRSRQLKFGCKIAAGLIALTIFLFMFSQGFAAYLVGGMIIFSASLVSLLDICIPSIIYNMYKGIE